MRKTNGFDIYGIELHKKLFQDCAEELDIIVEQSGLPPVKWKLFNIDALTWQSEIMFDLVKTIIRPTVNPGSLRYKGKEFIIFPYQCVDNQLIQMETNTFQSSQRQAQGIIVDSSIQL